MKTFDRLWKASFIFAFYLILFSSDLIAAGNLFNLKATNKANAIVEEPLSYKISYSKNGTYSNKNINIMVVAPPLISVLPSTSAYNYTNAPFESQTLNLTNDSVFANITADYCIAPGHVQLTATGGVTYAWNTNPVQTTAVILVKGAGHFIVTVTDENGNQGTASYDISGNLVSNGDFELGNVGFTSTYTYTNPGPDSLYIEDRYTVDENPSSSHTNFWGKDHTTNSGKFMIINGVASNYIWSQKIENLIPNTDYYFSAYAISLNNAKPFANLQFSVNGIQVGSVTGPLPSRPENNNPPYDWIQFYGIWNSGSSTTVVLSITDLESALDGNDFGLDDISFGTLPLPIVVAPKSNTPCEGEILQLSANIIGGKAPFIYNWTGPNGFTSHDANPSIQVATLTNAGIYTVQVTDQNNCSPVTENISAIVNPTPLCSITGLVDSVCPSSMTTYSAMPGMSSYFWEISGNATIAGSTNSPSVDVITGNNRNVAFMLKLTVTNSSGCKSICTQSVNVDDNLPPLVPLLADVTGECSATAAVPTTSDNCSGMITGTTSDPLIYNTQGTYVITWSFDDGNGNISIATQNVIVKDVTKPVVPVLADVTDECSATAAVPTTSDNCSGTITGTTSDPLIYNTQGTYVITWSFDDGNGNISTATQNVIVKDVTKPVVPVLADVTGECSATATVPTTSDNCSGTITGTTSDPLIYNTQGTYVITWSFDDGNGNISTATQNVIVKDVTKPEVPVLADVTGECSATAAVPTTSDNCSGTITGTTSDPLTYNTQGTYVIIWSFNDGNGNISTATQNVILNSTIIVNAGTDQTIKPGTATTLAGTATGGSGLLSYTWSPSNLLVSNNILNPTTLPLSSETLFTLTVLDAISGCSVSDDVKISMDDVERPIARDDYAITDITHSIIVDVQANDSDPIGLGLTISITTGPKKGTAILNEDGTITYTNSPNYTGKDINDTLTYTICDKGSPSKCASARLIITINPERQDFEIYNLVTPNGDGQNDYWYIQGIDQYVDNEINIFNRWGDKVSEFKSYNNETNRWNGTNKNGEFLPDGIYFYVIKIKELGDYTGWIYVRTKGNN